MVRVKYRYFLLEIICDDYGNERTLKLPVDSKELYFAIHLAICDVLGDFGCGSLTDGLAVKMLNPYSRIGYLRTRRGAHLSLGAVLPFVTSIGRLQCSLKTLHLGGTLRSCHKFLQRFHHQHLASLLSRCETAEERQAVQDSIKFSIKNATK
ncbi:hypothetical protein CHUAL_002523 [Chamberlinius hualienensis]